MKIKPWMILLPLLVGSIAYAQYLQSGPYSEPHTAVSNGCVEVRADMGGGWSQMCIGTSAGQLAAADDTRFLPSGGTSSQVLRGDKTWGSTPDASLNAVLQALLGLTPTSGNVITGNGTGWTSQPPGAPALYFSGRLTGNGGAQNTAHGLGVVPRVCLATVAKLPALAGILTLAATLYTPGTHTDTNCVFTVLSGADYYVMAVS